MTSHYLNQWWQVYWHIYASLGLNKLTKMGLNFYNKLWCIARCVKIHKLRSTDMYINMPWYQMIFGSKKHLYLITYFCKISFLHQTGYSDMQHLKLLHSVYWLIACVVWQFYFICFCGNNFAEIHITITVVWHHRFNSSPPAQNGCHFADNIVIFIFVNGKFCILIKSSLKFVPKGPIGKNPAWV